MSGTELCVTSRIMKTRPHVVKFFMETVDKENNYLEYILSDEHFTVVVVNKKDYAKRLTFQIPNTFNVKVSLPARVCVPQTKADL